MATNVSGSAFDVDGSLVQSDTSLLVGFAGEGIKAGDRYGRAVVVGSGDYC